MAINTTRRRQLVLLGAGASHLALLRQLARRPVTALELVLVTPHDPVFLAHTLPEFVAGRSSAEQCSIALAPLLRASGARWLARRAVALDADQHSVLLDNGDALQYELLSVNTGLVQSRTQIETQLPGAREHGLFVGHAASFAALWPRVMALPQLRSIAVLGTGSDAVQLALALRQRLAQVAISLITGGHELLPGYPASLQHALRQTLRRQSVTLLPQRALELAATEVLLEGGAGLVCDVPLLALPAQQPGWLVQSGLALNQQQALAVDSSGRSRSHPQVFLQGDLLAGHQQQRLRTPLHSWRAAAALRANLERLCAGQPTRPVPLHSLSLLSGARQRAFGCWRDWTVQGRLVWLGKDLLERRFSAQLRDPPQAGLDNTLT